MLTTVAQIPHETVIPAFAALLDPDAVLAGCQSQWSRVDEPTRFSWRSARMIEALYHPQRHLRVAYVLLTDPATDPSRYWPEGRIVYFHSPVRLPLSRRGDLLSIDGSPVEIYGFPNDRRLRGLRQAAGRIHGMHQWKDWLMQSGNDDRFDAASMQRLMVRYVPEQKWVVRLRAVWNSNGSTDDEIRRLAVRACRSSTCERLVQRHREFAAMKNAGQAAFRIPELVGHSSDRGLLGVEWIRGATLIETLRQQEPSVVMGEVLQRLQSFRAASLSNLELMTHEHLARKISFAARDLSLAAPELIEPIRRIAAQCVSELSSLAETTSPVTLHNDFHWNQLAIKKDRFTLFDLDRMARGDALIDVANLAAQLEMLGRRPDVFVAAEESRQWRNAVLQTWLLQNPKNLDIRRFHVYASVARWEVARGLLRHLRPGWMTFAQACLEHIESDLRLAGTGGWR